MADETQIGVTESSAKTNVETTFKDNNNYEKMMSERLDDIYKAITSRDMSQSSARDYLRDSGRTFRNRNKGSFKGSSRVRDGFIDEFENALLEGFLGKDFRSRLKGSANKFADELGVHLDDLTSEIGKQLGKSAANIVKNSDLGKQLSSSLKDLATSKLSGTVKEKSQSTLKNILSGGYDDKAIKRINSLTGKGSALGDLGSKAGTRVTALASKSASSLARFAPALGANLGAAATAAGGLAAAALPLAAVLAGVVVGFKLLQYTLKNVKDAMKGFKDLSAAFVKAGNRYQATLEKNQEAANARLKADVETIVREPFNILKEAAEAVYRAWDENLRLINATQGYTKADQQNLFAAYADRLRSEGLSDAISAANIQDNLANVLKSGMSGKIAEEFAYQATKLNALIPTQDFFSYAATYAAQASSYVKAGMSQEAAIRKANEGLEEFASGLLYATRNLSGGFTTGLTNAQDIYEKSVKIAQASRTGSASEISGVLLAVASEVGSIAPDLVSSVTDLIYKAATGGNDANIVALRSLANINASNTEFIQALAKDPQKVFSTIFRNLAAMYTGSGSAYMETGAGYAELFGMSAEMFQRINFSDLAQSISSMNMDNSALDENTALLVAGQTTTNAEILKNREINQYLVENGLSLVLDNEAARAIQQHMWDEQIARELTQATFAVDLQGEASKALLMIRNAIENILSFLNPLAHLKKLGNIVQTTREINAHNEDIRKVLELGKVGEGNERSMYQLTTRGQNLNVVDNLVELLGGRSSFKSVNNQTRWWNTEATSPFGGYQYGRRVGNLIGGVGNLLKGGVGPTSISSPSSSYSWGGVSKSTAAAIGQALRSANNELAGKVSMSGAGVASASAEKVKSIIDNMLSDSYLLEKYVKQGKSYEDWASSASRMGIADLGQALESAGYNETDVRNYFQNKETEQGLESQHEIREHEWKFRETGMSFWTEEFPTNYRDPLFELFETNNTLLGDIITRQDEWKELYTDQWLNTSWKEYFGGISGDGLFNRLYKEFMKYFIYHTYYSSTSGYNYQDVVDIQKKSRDAERGDAVYALAEMLTKNLLDLKDPTIQTNALLAQILIVVNAIQNQQNEVAGTIGQNSLLNSLSGMALGLTSEDTGSAELAATST